MAADGPALEPPPGAIVFGYDGSSASERAIRSTAPLLAHKRALVVTVWAPEVGYAVLPPGVAPAPIDIRASLEVDERLCDAARRSKERRRRGSSGSTRRDWR